MKLKFVTIFLSGFFIVSTLCLTFEERKAELTKKLNRDEAKLFSFSSRSRERFYNYNYGYGYPYYYTTPGFPLNLFYTPPPPQYPFPFNLFTTRPPPPFPLNLFVTTPPPFPFNLIGKKK